MTDGVYDDVLNVVKGIAGDTLIELTQGEKGIMKDMVQTKKSILKKESEDVTHRVIRVPKSIAGETTIKMTHDKVGICRRYCLQKEMCI